MKVCKGCGGELEQITTWRHKNENFFWKVDHVAAAAPGMAVESVRTFVIHDIDPVEKPDPPVEG